MANEGISLEEWGKLIIYKNRYTYKDLNLKVRKCCKCSSEMHWATFVMGHHNKVQREHFTHEMLKEIWANDIFVIKCCECYNRPFFTKEFIEMCEKAKRKRRKVMLTL